MQPCVVLFDSTRLLLFRMIEKESFRSSIIKTAELPTRLLLESHECLQEFYVTSVTRAYVVPLRAQISQVVPFWVKPHVSVPSSHFGLPGEKTPEIVTLSHL